MWSFILYAALSGVVLYNYLKAKEAKAAVTLPTDAPPEKKPLTAKVIRPTVFLVYNKLSKHDLGLSVSLLSAFITFKLAWSNSKLKLGNVCVHLVNLSDDKCGRALAGEKA